MNFGADNIGYRDQRFAGTYERTGCRDDHRPLGPDPAVLQRRHEHAVLANRRHANRSRRRDPAGDSERPDQHARLHPAGDRSSTCANGATSATLTARVTPTRALDFTSRSRRHGTPANCRGAPVSASATTSRWRCPTTRAPTTFRSGAEWSNDKAMMRVAYDGSWFDNLDDTLVWDSPLRIDATIQRAERGPHGAVAVEHRADGQHRPATRNSRGARRPRLVLRSGHGATTSRSCRSPSTRRCRNWRCRGPTTDGEAQIFSANIGLVSRPSSDWRFSARLRHYGFDNNTPQAGHPAVRQLRHVGQGRRRPAARAVRARAARTSRPMRPGRGCSRWRITAGYTARTPTATSTGSSRAATSRCSRSRPTPWATSG